MHINLTKRFSRYFSSLWFTMAGLFLRTYNTAFSFAEVSPVNGNAIAASQG